MVTTGFKGIVVAKTKSVKLTKKTIDSAVAASGRRDVWDSVLPGFGVRISMAGTRTFILRYRPKGGGRAAPKRFMTLGRYGPLTVEEARTRARRILGAVAD